MAKLKITMQSGEVLEVTGRRFSHYVGPYRFWFFLHKSVDAHGFGVTHYDSGKRVLQIPANSVLACLGDEKAAAKMELDKLVERVGAERMRSVLSAG